MGIHDEKKIMFNYYVILMSEIKCRADVIKYIHENEYTTKLLLTDIECCALQLRKILELILVSTLVANKKEFEKQRKSFEHNWQIKNKIKEIKKINPNYFPLGMKIPEGKFPRELTDWVLREPTAPSLFKEKDFSKAYKFTSKYLHVQNPFDPKQQLINLNDFYNELLEYLNKIMNLLSAHRVTLCNGDIIYCEIKDKKGSEAGIDISYFAKETHEN